MEVGFVAADVDAAQIDEFGLPPLDTRAEQPALVAVARVIGLETGDTLALALHDPSGRRVALGAPPPFDRPKAQWTLRAGIRRPATTGLAPGEWTARFTVTRDGRAVIEKTFSVKMP